VVLTLLLVSAAHAQPVEAPQQPPATAERTPAMLAFQEGRTLLEAGQLAEACAKFMVSIEADPDAPGTLLNLGLCNEMLGKIATALRWYRKAQFRAAETQMTDYEAVAKQHAFALASKVPTLRIDAAPGANVVLDGEPVSEHDRVRIEVDAGTHVIELGRERRTITVKEGDKQTIDLRPPPPKQYVVIDRGVTQRRYAYIALGTGVAFYAASTTLTLVGKGKYDAADHPETYLYWQDVVRYGGTSLFLVGSAAIATGVYFYVKAPRKERVEQVIPIVGTNQVGVAVAGSF